MVNSDKLLNAGILIFLLQKYQNKLFIHIEEDIQINNIRIQDATAIINIIEYSFLDGSPEHH